MRWNRKRGRFCCGEGQTEPAGFLPCYALFLLNPAGYYSVPFLRSPPLPSAPLHSSPPPFYPTVSCYDSACSPSLRFAPSESRSSHPASRRQHLRAAAAAACLPTGQDLGKRERKGIQYITFDSPGITNPARALEPAIDSHQRLASINLRPASSEIT